MSTEKRKLLGKLAWVPNLFTLGNLTLGFLSVLISMTSQQKPELLSLACVLIMLAVLFDGMDGAMARLLKASSELGAQLDSLADLTTFGIAPGVLMYVFVLQDANWTLPGGAGFPAGMLIAAVFPAFAAYRLARFNVEHTHDGFSGLPSPVAGAIVALMPLVFDHPEGGLSIFLSGIFILVALLMISTLRYAKPQVMIFRRMSPARMALALVFILGVILAIHFRYGLSYSAGALFTLIVMYIVTGLVSFLFHLVQVYRM